MMSGNLLWRALAGASLLPLFVAAPAAAQNQTFLDVQGGLGYSTNPQLRPDGVGSAFARVSAYGFHNWGSETSNSSVSAYAENTYYFRQLGNRQLFSLEANNTTRVNEKVSVFGTLGASADYGAQLSSRFIGAPADAIPANPAFPPTSVVVVTPDLVALSQRQYQVNGLAGASFVMSPRDSLVGTIGARKIWIDENDANNLALGDYSAIDSSLTWRRQFTERVSGGIKLIASRADYTGDRSVLSYGPQLTGDIQLSESTQFGGSIGFVRTERNLGPLGNRNSTDLALDASLCRELEYERFCGRVGRRTQTLGIGSAGVSTSATADYSRRLNARDQIQAALAFTTTDEVQEVALGRQNFYSLSGSFDRKINPRLSAGVNLAARKFTIAGPDPKTDIGGSIFIRNRFGSIR